MSPDLTPAHGTERGQCSSVNSFSVNTPLILPSKFPVSSPPQSAARLLVCVVACRTEGVLAEKQSPLLLAGTKTEIVLLCLSNQMETFSQAPKSHPSPGNDAHLP